MNRAMRRAAAGHNTNQRARHIGMHPLIAAGIRRTDKEIRAAEIARPMRELFRQLKTGEVTEVPVFDDEGNFIRYAASMLVPELDASLRQSDTDWVEIAPAIEGWVDCWVRLSPKLRQDKLRYLADRLNRGELVTPRMVEQASEQFEAAIRMIPAMADGAIKSAVLTTQLAWEFEKINTKETA